MNDYVAGGYSALAAILVLYVMHLRHRARVLSRALPPTDPPAFPPRVDRS
jgi:hypothetical protein